MAQNTPDAPDPLAGLNPADLLRQGAAADTQTVAGDGYSEAAAQTGTDEGALRVAAHRLRKRYRELLKNEIAHTLASPESVEAELASLMAAFR